MYKEKLIKYGSRDNPILNTDETHSLISISHCCASNTGSSLPNNKYSGHLHERLFSFALIIFPLLFASDYLNCLTEWGHYATIRKVACSSPDDVIKLFQLT
jgi:hypothetical protein